MNSNEKEKEVLSLLDKHVGNSMKSFSEVSGLKKGGTHYDVFESVLQACFLRFKRECDLLNTERVTNTQTFHGGIKVNNAD